MFTRGKLKHIETPNVWIEIKSAFSLTLNAEKAGKLGKACYLVTLENLYEVLSEATRGYLYPPSYPISTHPAALKQTKQNNTISESTSEKSGKTRKEILLMVPAIFLAT